MLFDDLKHAQRERLIYLDRCLTWRGMANRRDLMQRFGLSSAQAALDFREYLARTETPPDYDPVRKAYVAAADHRPLAPSGLTEAFDAVFGSGEDADALPRPERRADAATIARLYQAQKGRLALCIRYTSMTSGADAGQWIAPTRFTSDGESVHLRAYSFKHAEYRNYLPVRIDPASTFETRALAEPLPEDADWATRAVIRLRPRTGLTEEQAAVVRREYGFSGAFLEVETRKALEFFLDRRWGLDQPGARLERAGTDYLPMPG